MKLWRVAASAAAAAIVLGGAAGAYAATGSGIPDSAAGPGWRAPTVVPGGTGGSLGRVYPVSTDDIWATGSDSNDKALLVHYDGTSWRRIAMPTGEKHVKRFAAGGAGNTWLMTYDKYQGNFEYTGEKLWRWVGGAWQRQDSYRDVYTALGTDTRWAVDNGFIERYDGARWYRHRIPADVQVTFVHTDGADGVWAIGQHYPTDQAGDPVAGALYALHWDGTHYRQTAMPDESTGGEAGNLAAMAGSAPDDTYVVGLWENYNGDLVRLIMVHWDGSRWSDVAVPDLSRGGETMATSRHGGLWVTGEFAFDKTVLYREPNGSWQHIRPSGKNPIAINAVANIPGTDRAIGVGAQGVATPDGYHPAISYDK